MEEQNDVNSIEKEFNVIDSRKLWMIKYQEIMKECIKFDYTLLEAKKLKNKNLNRYRDVSPYDHSRIILSKGPCDYINANLIKMEKAHRQYILTQGPLPNTTPHFWLMVWEQNCKAVLMLNRIVEKNQVKCHQYWPIGSLHGGDDIMVLTEVGLKIENIKENEFSYYTTRILRLTEIETGSSRDILHFHYTTWPDFGVPQSPTVFLSFLSLVRESGALDQNVGPPVVHCSAGIGRSGTFCLVDSCLVMMKENGCNSVNVQDVLIDMRRQRMGLIQTADQLRFSYLAIIEGSKMDLENIYDNDLINANHRRTSEDEEEPPPLPPPRGESLKNTLPPLPPVPENNLLPPLPCEPNVSSSSSSSSSEESSPIHQISENGTQNKNTNFDLRQRKRKIQQTLTAERIEEMKRKQQNAEYWNRIKRSILQPFSLGLGAILIGGGLLVFSYYVNRV